jgi:Protein of unknown function (DUF3182)
MDRMSTFVSQHAATRLGSSPTGDSAVLDTKWPLPAQSERGFRQQHCQRQITSRGVVVVYSSRLGLPLYAHERATLLNVAGAIAQLKRQEFAGWHDPGRCYEGCIFCVPDDTLMPDEAAYLDIRAPTDFFGGIVPHPFVKTKAITHELVDTTADRPLGWAPAFAKRVRDVVLPGYTVFSVSDACTAATRMLRIGPVRIKKTLGCGGGGQMVVTSIREVETFLESYPAGEMALYGLVLEAHLYSVATYSVGQIRIDDTMVTYHGTQRVTKDNQGRLVYGGSDLRCVRGGWESLAELPMTPEVRLGVAQARRYDEAMSEYPGFSASRRNYDVGQGIDNEGRFQSGVLEASWRSGGASPAEIVAFAAFMQDPDLDVVEASAVKEFGKNRTPPAGALIQFCGDDPQDGPTLRYAIVVANDGRSRAKQG